MVNNQYIESLLGLQKAEAIYGRVIKLSGLAFRAEDLADKQEHLKELEFLLEGVRSAETILTIFNHKTYLPELEVGQESFWGWSSHQTGEKKMHNVLSLLHKDYVKFPYESVTWLTEIFPKIPFSERVNMKIHHCCMRFVKPDGKEVRLFSQGVPVQLDEERNFQYTLNYIQNIHYLIKRDFPYYWIRLSYGEQQEHVQTFHSDTQESGKRDLLSPREKEILLLIAEDLETKEIANRLYISNNTVANHRGNMIERLGVRDTTALVQLAKMTGMI